MYKDATGFDISDFDRLTRYLHSREWVASSSPLHISLLKGGVSCTTVRVRQENGIDMVIKQALPQLRVDSQWLSSPERAHCEALGIKLLQQLLPAGTIPPLIFEDRKRHLLAMQFAATPHDNWKQSLLAGEIHVEHARQFGELLASIHEGALVRGDEIEPVFNNRSFFETLRMEAYYEFAAHGVPAASCFIGDLLADTRRREITLVHGDYSPKNVLIHNNRLILLDHETLHWGDPMFDIGFSLTHFLSKANHLADRRDDLATMASTHWTAYRDHANHLITEAEAEQRAVRHTLACLLARVHGRSPLEYLDLPERSRQTRVTLDLMARTPKTISQLVEQFVNMLEP